jgi:tetratricopeptide (TPR) repeat protein
MSDIDDAITAYKQAVENLPQAPADDANIRALAALLARERVAQALVHADTTPEMLMGIVETDQALKGQAKKINEVVGSARLADWRESRQRPVADASADPQAAWWWALDSRAGGIQWHTRALNYFLWICIVVSLSFVVESLRRFLSGEVGILGTVLQGLVTLLVGSTLVEVAKQVSAVRSGKPEGWKSPSLKRRTAFTTLLIGVALVMWFLLPQVVKFYSNRGVSERYGGQLSNPIGHFQRTISLEPSDAIAHYSLAKSYETIGEYDKAETEYKSAIRWGDDQAVFYDGLAHLMIAQKKDYVGSLRLLDTGLDKLEAQQKAGEFNNEDDYRRIKVSLLRNRGWAYLTLNYLTQAEDDLRTAIDLKPEAAAPHCLLGQILEKRQARGDKSTGREADKETHQAYKNCIAFSRGQKDKIEADWFAHAQERLNLEDEKQEAGKQQERATGRPQKKP